MTVYPRSCAGFIDRVGTDLDALIPDGADELFTVAKKRFKEPSVKTLTHEAGHFFGLGHTHNEQFSGYLRP